MMKNYLDDNMENDLNNSFLENYLDKSINEFFEEKDFSLRKYLDEEDFNFPKIQLSTYITATAN